MVPIAVENNGTCNTGGVHAYSYAEYMGKIRLVNSVLLNTFLY